MNGWRLVQTWPRALCEYTPTRCSGTNISRWTIHGFWPYDQYGTSLHNCRAGTPFNPSLVSSFRAQLVYAWPNFGNGPADSTWRYQWNKHGRCSVGRLTQTRYFRKALDLYNSLDVGGTLAFNRINPDGLYYNVGLIRGVLAAKFGAQPTVHCVPNAAKTETLLYEIYVCIDTSFNIVNCGGSGHAGCGNLGAGAKYI